jgi:hypothetical protein
MLLKTAAEAQQKANDVTSSITTLERHGLVINQGGFIHRLESLEKKFDNLEHKMTTMEALLYEILAKLNGKNKIVVALIITKEEVMMKIE